jgi:hypothetical protein
MSQVEFDAERRKNAREWAESLNDPTLAYAIESDEHLVRQAQAHLDNARIRLEALQAVRKERADAPA